ncbi:chromatin assembly factor 1 subunit B isoform X1 [Centruroides vittatus]|uniref:chromatin assembly factor 1 subunit B isoform X1 n=1 Tax=Centruroides vittatus TaxID=120091 RepID=UPI00350FA4E9
MKCYIPQISWHNRDPVLSIDFQMCQDEIRRLATAGTDAHILIWFVTLNSNGSTSLEFAADLFRHTKAVNIVRFSPNGELLASGDDEANIILWKQQKDDSFSYIEETNQDKEHWTALKILRGHLDDVCDLSWSANSNFLISGSVDNTAILWDVQKGKNVGLLTDPKGFVQGVTWDPVHQYIATISSDRAMRIYNLNNKRVMHKVQKTVIPSEKNKGSNKSTRMFYDDTLKSFCRRLTFSPDGELLIVPSGIVEQDDGKFINTTYVFSRLSLNKPVMHLPTGDKYTVAVRCCPIYFELVPQNDNSQEADDKPWIKNKSVLSLPYRLVFAVATKDSVLLYDTQHTLPLAHVTKIHYTHLTDLAWSHDGRCLIISSTDGYCSFITFAKDELGIPYTKKSNNEENLSSEAKTDLAEQLEEIINIEEKCKDIKINSQLNCSTPYTTSKKGKCLEDYWKNTKEEQEQWKLVMEPSNTSPVKSTCTCDEPIVIDSEGDDMKISAKALVLVEKLEENVHKQPTSRQLEIKMVTIPPALQTENKDAESSNTLLKSPKLESKETSPKSSNSTPFDTPKFNPAPAHTSPKIRSQKPGRRIQLITLSAPKKKD